MMLDVILSFLFWSLLAVFPLQKLQGYANASAMEMPVELLRAAEMDEELPPSVLDANLDNVMVGEDNGVDKTEVNLLPTWLHHHHEPDQQPQPLDNTKHASTTNKAFGKQKPLHKQPAQNQRVATVNSALRRCSMEITNTISGICQHMPPLGSACISGEYVDFLNVGCM